LEKFGGKLQLNAHVNKIIVDEETGRATGVELKNGNIIKARKAVVSNATPFDTVKMLKPDEQKLPAGVETWRSELGKLPRHGAIMHLFLAIDATGESHSVSARLDEDENTRDESREMKLN